MSLGHDSMGWRAWLGVGERRWKRAYDEEVQPSKTLWDWLQLLIVPAILIGVTVVWSAAQSRGDNKREDRRIAADRLAAEVARRDATLRAYLNQMSGLMLHEKLLTSDADDAVRAVARTVTITSLRRLDAGRRAAVVHFLSEARLLRGESPLVVLEDANLMGADLSGADLSDTFLVSTNLGFADLRGADLRGADLRRANLIFADLRGADLRDTILEDAYFLKAKLKDANVTGADLTGAVRLRLKGTVGLPRKRGDRDPRVYQSRGTVRG